MSAFICDDKTISVIAKAFDTYGVDYKADDYERPIQIIVNLNELRRGIGQSLLNQNYASVNYRYNEDNEVPVFEYEDVDIDEGVVYGCIHCYNYQACETNDYFETDLYYSLRRLEEALLRSLIRKNGLTAHWGYDGIELD